MKKISLYFFNENVWAMLLTVTMVFLITLVKKQQSELLEKKFTEKIERNKYETSYSNFVLELK